MKSIGAFSIAPAMSADAISQADYECAEMLTDHWGEDGHPLESGEPLIIFDRLVIAVPHPDIWSVLIAAMAKASRAGAAP